MKPEENRSFEADSLKLVQEIEVVKDELFRQNEELRLALAKAETATALYDFAPSGYFTLDSEGNICELNLSGVIMLGKQRPQLINGNFRFFISKDTLPAFNVFLANIFESKMKQTCEIQLSIEGKPSVFLQVEGIISFQNMRKCLITAIDITELKKSEEAMRESAYFFKESQKAAFIGSYKTNFPADYWESSEVLDQIFGIDKNYVRSVKGWLDLVHPEDTEMMNNHLQTDVFKHRNHFNKEYRIIRKSNGQVRWVHGLGKVTFDSNGRAISLTGTIQDITSRKISENRLSKSEKRLKLLADNSNDFIWVLDPETMHFIYVSPSCENLLGYSTYEMLQNPFEIILVPEIRDAFIQRAKDGIKKLSMNPIPHTRDLKEVMQLRKDGTTLITEVAYKAYFNQNTGKIEIQGVSRDVTDRIKAERALKQSEEKYRMLAETMKDVVWTMDISTLRFLYISPSVVKLRGYTPDEIYAEPMNAALTPQSRTLVTQLLHQRCADFLAGRISTETYFTDEIEQTCKDGSNVWTEIISHLWLNKNSGLIELHGVSRNLNERKRFELTLKENEARLHELNATKDKFFSIIAHDLKNPFNAIIGFSNLLIDQVKDKDYEGIDEYATIIKDSSLRAMSLLNNLLIWSRSQTGRIEFNPEYFELVKLIIEVTELLNDSAKQKSIEISSELPHNILVLADKEMISTVLRNLISNAIKFTHPDGRITVSAHLQEEGWVLEVGDNGMGIKKEFIPKLFRIEESYSTKGTHDELGTGLGLLLCKEFISKHKGKIWVESEYGKGSKFSFLIPK